MATDAPPPLFIRPPGRQPGVVNPTITCCGGNARTLFWQELPPISTRLMHVLIGLFLCAVSPCVMQDGESVESRWCFTAAKWQDRVAGEAAQDPDGGTASPRPHGCRFDLTPFASLVLKHLCIILAAGERRRREKRRYLHKVKRHTHRLSAYPSTLITSRR